MTTETRHILLMGFKHVGKSALGKELSTRLNLPFYELDALIEARHSVVSGKKATCREIVQTHGEEYFRTLETEALADVVTRPRGVVALGGGTPMRAVNQALIRSQFPIHITAPSDTVRSRVVAAGWPQSGNFDRLWHERLPVYHILAAATVDNSDGLDATVATILELLK